MGKFKEWLKLLNDGLNCGDEISRLYGQRGLLGSELFDERIQSTGKAFKRQVSDFVVPTDWGKSDPCIVTIFRHAIVDWDGFVTNIGTEDDVKTFSCPYFLEERKCINPLCKFYKSLQEYDTLTRKIEDLQAKRAAIRVQRKAAWRQMFNFKSM